MSDDNNQALNFLLQSQIQEQKVSRRWKIFFKLSYLGLFIYFALIPFNLTRSDLPQPLLTTKSHTALIEIQGEISSASEANADNIINALKNAYRNKNVKGIILKINSPGGSPVQARQIYRAIVKMQAAHPTVKIYASIEDVGASAAYLIASAAENIYCDKTSIVGSIGVILDSFGFVETMQKLGVERRLYTAGAHKGILDPFSPKNESEDKHIHHQLDLTHQVFIENVKMGRKTRLKLEDPTLFSGLFWTGEEALRLGLVDGHLDIQDIAKDIIEAVDIVDYSPPMNLLEKLTQKLAQSMVHTLGLESGLKGFR